VRGDEAIDGAILSQQDAESRQGLGGTILRGRERRAGGEAKNRGEGEGGAPARLTLDRNLAAHELDELAAMLSPRPVRQSAAWWRHRPA